MVMTVLEGTVPESAWQALRDAYTERSESVPPQMVETFLAQSASEPEVWRAISIWKSREALEEMRRTAGTPTGVLIFRAAGVEPRLSIFDVVATRRP